MTLYLPSLSVVAVSLNPVELIVKMTVDFIPLSPFLTVPLALVAVAEVRLRESPPV